MAQTPYGYRYGPQDIKLIPLDKDCANISDCIAITTTDATAGYAKELDATTEGIIGFSAGAVTLTGTSDGDHSVKVDLSTESVYAFPPDAGTATIALIGKSMDMGADGKSVNIDATVIDCVTCVWVDATNNIVYVKRMPASMGTV